MLKLWSCQIPKVDIGGLGHYDPCRGMAGGPIACERHGGGAIQRDREQERVREREKQKERERERDTHTHTHSHVPLDVFRTHRQRS